MQNADKLSVEPTETRHFFPENITFDRLNQHFA